MIDQKLCLNIYFVVVVQMIKCIYSYLLFCWENIEEKSIKKI